MPFKLLDYIFKSFCNIKLFLGLFKIFQRLGDILTNLFVLGAIGIHYRNSVGGNVL